MQKSILSKIGLVILLGIILFRPTQYILTHQEKYFGRNYHTRYNSLKTLYGESQYVKKKNPYVITDETFEEFAGGFFLKGNNPILIVHDHPPLGRYMISASIYFFDNSNTEIVILYALTVVVLILLAYEVLQNYLLALIPTGIFLNESLFFDKLIHSPLPEPIQLPFILSCLYFFIRGIQSKKYIYWFLATSFMIGVVISTRFFVTGIVLVGVFGSVLLLYKKLRNRIIPFILTLPLAPLVLMATYTVSIKDSGSILEPFHIQKYILAYHQSKFAKAFSYWDLILFNRWHTWWANQAIIQDDQWRIWWPISIVMTGMLGILGLFKIIKLTLPEVVLFLWLIYYSLMLSTGYTSTRYFLPILPILYILSLQLVLNMYTIWKERK